MKRRALLIALSVIGAPPAFAAAAAPDARPVTLSAELDRSAVWVGDVLRYTVRAVHGPDVEIVLDNFKKDLLPVAPFSVRDIEIRRGDWAGGKTSVEIALELATYETGKTELTIPPLAVYYFTHAAGPAAKESPVESMTLPAVKIGLRSTLVPARPVPRATRAPLAHGLAAPVALLALGLAGVAGVAGYGGWRLWRRRHRVESTRRLTRQERDAIVHASLARVRADVAAAGDDPRRAAAAVAAALRGFAEAMFAIPAPALTPEEVAAALAASGLDKKTVAEINTVLARCDELHYGRDAAVPREPLLPAAERIMRSPQWVSA